MGDLVLFVTTGTSAQMGKHVSLLNAVSDGSPLRVLERGVVPGGAAALD